jgi:hypothetical protein
MAKPNADEIHQALELAREQAGDKTDEGRLARCFLYYHDRNLNLEEVYENTEHYLRSGMAEHEHARLLEALERAREAEHRQEHEDQDESMGLE